MWCTEWATFSLYPSNYPKTLKELLSISTRNVLLSVITKKNRYSDTKTIKGVYECHGGTRDTVCELPLRFGIKHRQVCLRCFQNKLDNSYT